MSALDLRTDSRLRYELQRVARVVRARRVHRRGALLWGALAVVAALLLVLPRWFPALGPSAALLLLLGFLTTAALVIWFVWRDATGAETVIDAIADQAPELAPALRAAAEQQPAANGSFHFLQRRLIREVLRHATDHDWAQPVRRDARRALAAHGLAMVAAFALSVGVLQQHRPRPPGSTPAFAGVEVTPGDVEVERGTTVVVAGRFGEPLPDAVILVWQAETGEVERLPMQRSLSDPLFGGTLRDVRGHGTYHLEHDERRTPSFRLHVYDRPALVRADATLQYPTYTRRAERRVEDTRTLSAVVGTRLEWELQVNQPVRRLALRRPDGTELLLAPADSDRTRFRLQEVISQSEQFVLHLEDDAGRTNANPEAFRIQAVENRRPEVALTFPRGDQRVSPLEEVSLQAEARDDFGLLDYGIAISTGTGAPEYISLAETAATPPVEAALAHHLALEERGVKPQELVTWFAWADDVGPDEQPRRTTSDLAFAEVRSLEEIFRENATGGGGNGGDGGPGEDLLETQRHISIALWKLQQDPGRERAEELETILESQQAARQQLAALGSQLTGAASQSAAAAAADFMEQTVGHLTDAVDRPAEDLQPAWSTAQGAYQALLRLQPAETSVAQSRSGGGGGGRRSQGQLDQLEFRHEDDRYATETQAQPPPTPEEREQLQVLARLRELARRQQHLNDRLQELQAALAAAEDEARREEIRRELKRLEDEQRQMMAELDETRQRVDRLQPGQRAQETRQQLEQTRQDMQRAREQLEAGDVSQALAAGTRAQEELDRTGEDLRSAASGRLGGQMRDARQQARELAQAQRNLVEDLERLAEGRQALDDRAARDEMASRLQDQAAARNQLLDTLRQVAEDSEAAEPQLHRQVYDLLRDESRSGVEQQLQAGVELLERGFIAPAREPQAEAARALERLQRAVEQAANSVLGDETTELRYAQRELDELTRELQRERPGEAGPTGSPEAAAPGTSLAEAAATPPPGTTADDSAATGEKTGAGSSPAAPGPTDGTGDALAELEQFARAAGGAGPEREGRGPLTGTGFAPWSERLRTVEELMEDADLRQQLAQARFQAEQLRREHQRHGQTPRWDLVETGIVAPLREARERVDQELQRRLQPDVLQPVDRDPVPERYAEAVRRYYEALGE